jgi:hypothetical protein
MFMGLKKNFFLFSVFFIFYFFFILFLFYFVTSIYFVDINTVLIWIIGTKKKSGTGVRETTSTHRQWNSGNVFHVARGCKLCQHYWWHLQKVREDDEEDEDSIRVVFEVDGSERAPSSVPDNSVVLIVENKPLPGGYYPSGKGLFFLFIH